MLYCIICNKSGSDGILLSNGAVYHKECLEKLLYHKLELSSEYSNTNREINTLEKKLNNFSNKILNYFFINSKRIGEIENELISYRKKIKTIDTISSEVSNKIKALYDYWLDYPPDWDERRRGLLNDNAYCQQCFKGYEKKVTLHIHHRIPVAKGGSHKRENLIVLCEDCHQSRHKHKLGKFDDGGLNPFEKKLYLIREAIEKNSNISFNYTKYEGEKSSRTIKPEEFKKVKISLCVRGYCFLRKDYRTFAIRRMSNLKLID